MSFNKLVYKFKKVNIYQNIIEWWWFHVRLRRDTLLVRSRQSAYTTSIGLKRRQHRFNLYQCLSFFTLITTIINIMQLKLLIVETKSITKINLEPSRPTL